MTKWKYDFLEMLFPLLPQELLKHCVGGFPHEQFFSLGEFKFTKINVVRMERNAESNVFVILFGFELNSKVKYIVNW